MPDGRKLLIFLALTCGFCAGGLAAFYLWWPLVFVVLTPYVFLVVRATTLPRAVLGGTVAAFAYFAAIQWFFAYMSFGGLLIGAAYQALLIVPVAAALWLVVRHGGWPLVLALPIFWVAGEYLRVLGPVGMPTTLPVATYRIPWMIQTADLAGIFGVSFALAAVNGAIADVLRGCFKRIEGVASVPSMRWRWPVSLAVVAAIWVFVAGYGSFRLWESDRTFETGPAIAVLQPDVPRIGGINHGFDPQLMFEQLKDWSEAAVEEGATLVLWPEDFGVLPYFNEELLTAEYSPDRALDLDFSDHRHVWESEMARRRHARDLLTAWTETLGAPLWMGTSDFLPADEAESPWAAYNTAVRFPRKEENAARQRKIRLFPMGEFIPWEGTAVDPWMTRLGVLREFRAGRRLYQRADERKVFRHEPAGWRHAVYICGEAMFPDPLLRANRERKPVDFALVMANDGGWQRSAATEIHFAFMPYRAVESRIGMARSANAGVSAFVRPDGRIHDAVAAESGLVRTGLGAPELPMIRELVRWRIENREALERDAALREELDRRIREIEEIRRAAGVEGYRVAPVILDARITFYSRFGDVFAQALVGTLILGLIPGFGVHKGRRERRL